MASIPPPPFFLQTPGNPPVRWEQWRGMFETYMVASAAIRYSAERKRALLLHCLGTEGQRIYNSLPDNNVAALQAQAQDDNAAPPDVYEIAIDKLNNHFTPKLNVVAERYKFRKRTQRHDESTTDYVRELRQLAISCKFGDMMEEMIRDQVVERTNSTRIRERLLLEPDLTLDTTMTIARQIESAVKESKIITESNSEASSTMNNVGLRFDGRKKRTNTRVSQPTLQHSKPRKVFSQCYRCGDKSHKANNPRCKARNVTCSRCNKVGHYAKVCNSTTVGQLNSELHVLTLGSDLKIVKEVMIGASVPVKMTVDTGSPISIIPMSMFKKYFVLETLDNTTVKLTTYLKEPINVYGTFKTNVSLPGYSNVVTEIFVVESSIPIMGLDLISKLGIKIDAGKIMVVEEKSNVNATKDIRKQYSVLFNESVGLANNYGHKVKVNPSVIPVQQKLRNLPYSVRNEVEKELEKLEANGIIEKIDASEWVSPLVVAYKKSGKVRLCVDLRAVNKAVIVDKYPLPNIQELLGELHGAQVFSSLDMNSAYHQLLLHEDSRDLTTFITHVGLFRFKRVCFGLASAPSAFQKLMASALSGLKGVQCYLDDIVIFGKNQRDHDNNLHAVLQRLIKLGLTLNYDKCKFGVQSLRFLGHTISPDSANG